MELQCGGPFTSVAGCCANGLGSVRQELDSSEDVDAVNSYRPFGLPLDGSGGDPYGFAGEPWESNVGLLYLRARYYNPYLNRFISPDTIVPDYAFPPSIHKYAYVHNNPVNFTDPSGHQAELPPDKEIEEMLKRHSYLRTRDYGWFDMGHAAPKNALIRDVRDRSKTGGSVKVGGEVAPPFTFITYYWVEKLNESQIEGVALGIMMRHDWEFEIWQSEFPLRRGEGTAFAIEDFPSNYMGFVAAVRAMKQGRTATKVDVAKLIIEHMGPVEPTNEPPPHSDNPPFECPESVICAQRWNIYAENVKNYDYTPRIRIPSGGYENIAWPCDELVIQSISSGPDTWRFLGLEHDRNVWTYLEYIVDQIKPW